MWFHSESVKILLISTKRPKLLIINYLCCFITDEKSCDLFAFNRVWNVWPKKSVCVKCFTNLLGFGLEMEFVARNKVVWHIMNFLQNEETFLANINQTPPPQDAKNYLVKSADMECLWILSFFTHLSPTCTIVLCRTNGRVLDELCQEIGYTSHLFEATDKHGDISPPFHLFDGHHMDLHTNANTPQCKCQLKMSLQYLSSTVHPV